MPMAVRTDAVEALTRAEVERIVEGRSSGAVEYRDDGAANRRCSHGSVRAVMPNPCDSASADASGDRHSFLWEMPRFALC